MLRYMLDTNVCIRVPARPPARVPAPGSTRKRTAPCISAVTLAELLHGAAKSDRAAEKRHEVERLTARFDVLPFDGEAAGHFGDIRPAWSARAARSGPTT
ncbi:type II toxin-antitoxin system VapC family toxin [Azospirillum sp. B21]|uniref:type II toxin-antitoxin system VapC family toxin n=1 Tax=Azospirillum sp. B21 TaxID=2607496 RepID=UPI001FFEFD64|nr:type II toxin-antitoxin system VapC family toxin [Azospirillum sp. B21]